MAARFSAPPKTAALKHKQLINTTTNQLSNKWTEYRHKDFILYDSKPLEGFIEIKY